MTIPSAPPPAAVTPGNLYADAGPRTLWLGVDPAVDPAGAVLVSDIVGILDEITAAIVTANAYTDGQVATRALLAHTHLHGDITDFTAAVTTVVEGIPGSAIPPGFIGMWSGSIADIGVGPLAGWRLCDGGGGTPDLRNRFILGAGTVATGTLNPNATASTSAAGGHTPAIGATTLTAAQIPAHVHAVNLTGNDTATTSSAGSHAHAINGKLLLNSGGASEYGAGSNGLDASPTTALAGAHTHTVTVSVNINGNTSSIGSGASHTHTATAVPDHSHTITSVNLRDALPFYALAYIMKL